MKKIIVLMLLLLPLGLMAQELKIAVVNTNEVMLAMPEAAEYESEMAKLRQQYEQEARTMEETFQRKYQDYIAQADSLTENIRVLRMQEVQDIRNRLETFVPMAEEEIQKKSESLLTPIRDKVQKAINSVGEENGYTYIMSPQVFLFQGNGAIDATQLVKAKLGLK